ncbi:hypothetical protein ACWGMA_13475 [Streptomyces asiaticus]
MATTTPPSTSLALIVYALAIRPHAGTAQHIAAGGEPVDRVTVAS